MTKEAPPNEYRVLLEQERDSLSAQLHELGYGGGERAGLNYDSNFADSSQVTVERGENEALVNELRSSLEDVERALQKMDTGRYGVCERCGQPISPARLEAMPAVKTCIECASQQR